MKFEDYLKIRHTLIPGQRQMKDNSAAQYNGRLANLRRLGFYNNELVLTEEMKQQISEYYNDRTNMYPRAIKYYIEYMEYSKQRAIGRD